MLQLDQSIQPVLLPNTSLTAFLTFVLRQKSSWLWEEKCKTCQNDPDDILNHELLFISTSQLTAGYYIRSCVPPTSYSSVIDCESKFPVKNCQWRSQVCHSVSTFSSLQTLLTNLMDNTTTCLDGTSLFPSMCLLLKAPHFQYQQWVWCQICSPHFLILVAPVPW